MRSDQNLPTWLAKDCFDVGIFTDSLQPMLGFWQTKVGLEFDHMLPTGGGVRQHRHELDGAVFKLNHSRDTIPPSVAGGFERLVIAKTDCEAENLLADPDGNDVAIVPLGRKGNEHWALEVATQNRDDFFSFYEGCLGLPRCDTNSNAVRCGKSQLVAVERSPAAADMSNIELRGKGFRYITLQVWDVDDVHAAVLSRGGLEGSPPRTLGQTARISFVRDNHGNWIELSQRASIVGSLEGAGAA